MAERTLRVLLLERNTGDADLVQGELDNGYSSVVVERVLSEEALSAALSGFPADVVLADRPLAERDGLSMYWAMRLQRPAVPFIILASTLDEETVVGFLRQGPDDLVLKSNLSRLRVAIEGAIDARKPLAKLSPRQIEVLHLVAEGCSTREIAEKLGLSVKTVESHRGAMMKRLELHDVAGLVRYAVRMGIVRSDWFDGNQ